MGTLHNVEITQGTSESMYHKLSIDGHDINTCQKLDIHFDARENGGKYAEVTMTFLANVTASIEADVKTEE